MGINPIPIALACTIAYTVQGLIMVGEDVQVSYPEWDNTGGFLGFLLDSFDIMTEAVTFLWQFSTFDIIGLPAYIGAPLGVACLGTISFAIIQLFRGV